ncbi:hypothetical protein [Capnocytophaga catalasegens]|uniref:Peptidylprolyl isomerase n=1 Tax=Capnocytophaga catalasegens TaxID=1004260 RepID=A0AAV5AWQ4_9FLAO|nr:hypothetical protein [Capnocytophaga catalasegens]GIZ15247.1 hypothetical protein RCZ03_12470 [Capnocytophaga catalasegens]GJM49761.1 hypothetical protein RCZ15_07360 [Capnocytophaga catalasegens]GJM52826.1 hypothetical protein RCZ16_11430 [Capnocytophaga catalasegens]
MIKTLKKLIVLSLLLGFISCDYFKKSETQPQAVARVDDDFLLKSDIEKILPQGYSLEDSVRIATGYVNSWALKKLLMIKAQENISNEQKEAFEQLVQEYRTDLYTQSYLEKLVAKKIDTTISQREREQFYQENKSIFKLNEGLIKLRYIHLHQDDEKNKNIAESFKRFNKKDKKQLDSLSLHFVSSFFNDSIWLKTIEVYDKLPFLKDKIEGKSGDLNWVLEQNDSTGYYLVKIRKLLKKDDEAPIEYARPTLRQIILNKRKLEYIKEIENDIINTAVKKKQFEVYE